MRHFDTMATICSYSMSAFSVKKTKPRKYVSRSPLKLPADELYHELGPKYGLIDVKVADRKIAFDIESGDWNTANAEALGGISSNTAQKVRKQVEVLQEENNMLKLKVEVLLNLVAESIAEISSN
ncbi:unnamed protein product [Adineta steineri]|uniref:Chibby-like protein n=1 Tax=Adineta steineri TaxID=433720 RepID=A0A818HYZ2_9BILA|nr:unnamed protein product [Adineta steineri]CAF3511812.1 unnamed protein product [Adineta steineri]